MNHQDHLTYATLLTQSIQSCCIIQDTIQQSSCQKKTSNNALILSNQPIAPKFLLLKKKSYELINTQLTLQSLMDIHEINVQTNMFPQQRNKTDIKQQKIKFIKNVNGEKFKYKLNNKFIPKIFPIQHNLENKILLESKNSSSSTQVSQKEFSAKQKQISDLSQNGFKQKKKILKRQKKSKLLLQNPETNLKQDRNSISANYKQISKYQLNEKNMDISEIRKKIIGFNSTFTSPFLFEIQALYVDHTATNRSYQTIQAMIVSAKQYCSNPLTELSHFGRYSNQLMKYSKDSLLKSFNAPKNQYIALPAGSGSTGAIQKAIKLLTIIENQWQQKPSIYLTPYQHHSNILPWVEYYEQVKVLASDENGNLVMKKILNQITQNQKKYIIITISAASNVTSKLTNLVEFNQLIKQLRKIKKIIFAVDCAAFCCHHDLNLSIYDEIDFAFLSPHKNLGGTQSCGVLIARKNLIQFSKPTFPGGGTATFVTGYSKEDVTYKVDIFAKQIAGTPPIIGFYRAALSFQLLKSIGYDNIHTRQMKNTQLFIQNINKINKKFKQQKLGSEVLIYGDKDFQKRANVITFNIKQNTGIINHNFISLLFTDIFGIQLRSGCFCAGPYGVDLLNLKKNKVSEIQEEINLGIATNKPGYLRFDLTFYLQLYQIQYMTKSIEAIARYSNNMTKFYTFFCDGQIRRHQFIKKHQPNRFSLKFLKEIQAQSKKLEVNHEIKMFHRQQTLKVQFQQGFNLLQNPIPFMSNLMKKFNTEDL